MSNAFAIGANTPIYSVSEISQALRDTVESNFSYIQVRGEISSAKPAASGHLYFSLKDSNAVLDAICWKTARHSLPFQPEDGLEVIATGKLTTYAGRSKYQIIVESMQIAGQGALLALLEKRRQALDAEGLFAAARKRPLPALPRVIGVITSPTGAVIRDILHRLRERFPSHVIVWPVLVQGDGAAAQITKALTGFNTLPPALPSPDVLILARGGGSIEDLWPFNDEAVVRAIAASRIPVISAIGHETDTTLADFAADCRAPTPTAAAEMAVPVRAQLLARLDELSHRLDGSLLHLARQKQQSLDDWAERFASPARLLQNHCDTLNGWQERLASSLRQTLLRYERRLAPLTISVRILQQAQHHKAKLLDQYQERLNHSLAAPWQERRASLHNAGRLLSSLSHRHVLARGFAYVTNQRGQLLPNAHTAATHSLLCVHFHDDTITVAPLKKRPLPNQTTTQGELL